MGKRISALLLSTIFLLSQFGLTVFAEELSPEPELQPIAPTYLQSVINTEMAIEMQKSTIFDASKSFLPDPDREVKYDWDFGDGNSNEGVEVLHAYKEPGSYTVTLTIDDGNELSEEKIDVFVYSKLAILITDQTENQDSIELLKKFAQNRGVHLAIIESFGSSTEFISEEILTKKLTESSDNLQKAQQIVVWTKENAGLNSITRYIQSNLGKNSADFSQKLILVLDNSPSKRVVRIQSQFQIISPELIVIAKEASLDALIESKDNSEFLNALKERGSVYEIIDKTSGHLRPWNFMRYFVNILVNNGIPDNTIALLLLLPVIATVVAFMRQVVGITTFGIYTPSIITLSFLVIGMYAGLLTLLTAIVVGTLSRPLLSKVRMLFIPKMAIVITLVSLTLFLVLIASIYLGLFDSQFLSIAIFPMLILSTLVEKFVSSKGEKSFTSATVLMAETVIVAIIAYLVAGGEINLGFVILKVDFVKNLLLSYPEAVFLLIIINILLGKWSGLRVLERVRFREVLRNIEE